MAKKLLVVDSNLAVHKLLQHNIPQDRYEVTFLNDGLSALDLMEKISPDLLLVDYHMEGIPINRFCEKVHQKRGGKDRPILLMVGSGDAFDRAAFMALGVVDFLNKPIEPRVLRERLNELSEEAATVVDRAPKTPPVEGPRLAPSDPPKPSPTASETMKIEELLGWSLPGEKQGRGGPPAAAEPDYETTVVQREVSVPAPSRSAPPPPNPSKDEVAPVSLREDIERTVVVPPPRPSSKPAPSESPAFQRGTTPEALETAFPHLYAGPETLEARARSETGSPKGASADAVPSPGPDSAQVEALAGKLAREIIEKVAWEVVPALAETLIKEELEKLKTEKSP